MSRKTRKIPGIAPWCKGVLVLAAILVLKIPVCAFQLVNSTTFNGSSNGIDEGTGIATDSSGNVWVTGDEGGDIWVAKFNATVAVAETIDPNAGKTIVLNPPSGQITVDIPPQTFSENVTVTVEVWAGATAFPFRLNSNGNAT